MYRSLNLERTRATLQKLVARIEDRFPESGLAQVARELDDVARETESKAAWISKPNYLLRAGAGLLIGTILAVLTLSFFTVDWSVGATFPLTEFIQVVEAGFNDLVLIGAAIFFLVNIENRVKRARVLSSLNELRAIAHVIDMHQLTKDPTELITQDLKRPSIPRHDLTAFELNRYLDYCSELLSLVSKLASVYAQHFPDGTVVSAINEVEALTTGLTRKIWQKIIILQGAGIALPPAVVAASAKATRPAAKTRAGTGRRGAARPKPKPNESQKPAGAVARGRRAGATPHNAAAAGEPD